MIGIVHLPTAPPDWPSWENIRPGVHITMFAGYQFQLSLTHSYKDCSDVELIRSTRDPGQTTQYMALGTIIFTESFFDETELLARFNDILTRLEAYAVLSVL